MNDKGFSLVEILIALVVFGIISAGVSSLLLANTKFRRETVQGSEEQQYLSSYLETLKRRWSFIDVYTTIHTDPDAFAGPPLPYGYTLSDLSIDVSCWNADGSPVSAPPNPSCSGVTNPPLRRVVVKLGGASLATEIGRPFAAAGATP